MSFRWLPEAAPGSVFKDHGVVNHGGLTCRHELTEHERELLAPLIPRAVTGWPRVADRQVIDGMAYKIRTGISWRDLPERYRPWQTVYTRFRRYALDEEDRHLLRSSGHTRITPALGKIRLKTDPRELPPSGRGGGSTPRMFQPLRG
ncbi:transposase [Streptomyces decoyicus]|uniref:transposase n=1 Tax=Streptomyces decoyicus TaxID=249567 RepID=UPI003F4B8311